MADRCPCDCKSLPAFTLDEVVNAGIDLGYLDADRVAGDITGEVGMARAGSPLEKLQIGMALEMEHCDITRGDPILTARIAISHLRENSLYYERLKEAGL